MLTPAWSKKKSPHILSLYAICYNELTLNNTIHKGVCCMNPKILVGITIQENSRRLIDEGARLSKELNAPLHILHIRKGETIFDHPDSSRLLDELFTYGGELGGEVHFVCGEHISQVFSSFVKENQITHLVIGEAPSDLSTKAPSVYDKLTNELNDIEIIVLQRNK